jgi:hypothetical protein
MKDVPTVGQLLTGEERRDAIHFAIAPVIAAEHLSPGQDVGFIEPGKVGASKNNIGIVDPFLRTSMVNPGDRFYLFLYPNTITGLRHEWTHPEFLADDEMKKEQDKAQKKQLAEAWLRSYHERHGFCEGFGEFVQSLARGEYVTAKGWDMHDWNDMPEFNELWRQIEAYYDQSFDLDHRTERTGYSCSC